MELKHLKRDPADKGKSLNMPERDEGYPVLVLDEASVKKLGLEDAEPGHEHSVMAKARVKHVSKSKDKNGHGHHTVHMEVTHMGHERRGKGGAKKKLGEMAMEEYAAARDPKSKHRQME
jgi:hypothetical protein